MQEERYTQYKRIDIRLSIVKLACLLFSVAICFKALYPENMALDYLLPYSTLMAFIIAVFYYAWAFMTKHKMRKFSKNTLEKLETIILGSIICLMIAVSGAEESPYKFLFLFLIITATIGQGKQRGINIALVGSGMILGMDLLLVRGVEVNKYFEQDLLLAGIFILTAWILGEYVYENLKYIQRLEELANYDGLTNVYNHRYFYEKLEYYFSEAKNRRKDLSVLFIDIDYFKFYNDCNGHQMGDKILERIGKLLKENVGGEGIVARYGGEEFAILLPDYNPSKAGEMAEKLRRIVEKTYFANQENQPDGNLTVSIGVASYPQGVHTEVELIKSADDALYRAKFLRKNRVEKASTLLEEIQKNIGEIDTPLIGAIRPLVAMIQMKDRYTYGHTERVVHYAKRLADALELSEETKKILICGAYMHDIGKVDIDKSILTKRMPLSEEEWTALRRHPEQGVELIQYVEYLEMTRPLIMYHHERYDGTGYPEGLKGKDIPYLARILTVVDSFDAMTSNRLYNKRKSIEEALLELERYAGTQFDPEITQTFITLIREKRI